MSDDNSIIKTLNNQTKKNNNIKKIGFLSTIMLVIGSSIGAGIFFKSSLVLNNAHSNLWLSISAWVIASIGVIAMALALVEIASSYKSSDKGKMEWNKLFNSKFIYYGCKNFMTFIYMPATYFFMPVYAIQTILDALSSFGMDVSGVQWWMILILALAIDTWFIVISGRSSRMGNIQNWIASMLKFIPLGVAMIIGFVIFAQVNGELPGNINSGNTTYQKWDLIGISPAFGLFSSLSAIFFAYDGFYVACGVQSQMKNPKTAPAALVIGLSLVTAIYLIISISCLLGSGSGEWFGFANFFKNNNLGWLYGTFSLLITFGVLGIINGYGIWTPRFIESLIADDELFMVCRRWKYKINLNKPVVGVNFSLITSLPTVAILCIIGSLAYINKDYSYVNENVSKLYGFADLTSSWTAIITFAFICVAIFGGLVNRKTNRVPVTKNWYFIPSAIISLLLIFTSLAVELINPFYRLISISILISNNDQSVNTDTLISSIMLVVVLFIYIGGSFGANYFDYKNEKYSKNYSFTLLR